MAEALRESPNDTRKYFYSLIVLLWYYFVKLYLQRSFSTWLLTKLEGRNFSNGDYNVFEEAALITPDCFRCRYGELKGNIYARNSRLCGCHCSLYKVILRTHVNLQNMSTFVVTFQIIVKIDGILKQKWISWPLFIDSQKFCGVFLNKDLKSDKTKMTHLTYVGRHIRIPY